MAGAAATGVVGSSPFDCLFTRAPDGTFAAIERRDIGALLRLVVHPATYLSFACSLERVGDGRRDAKKKVLEDLFYAILKGDPPECPPISRANVFPLLRLTAVQKRHLERVLLEGSPTDSNVRPPLLRHPGTYLKPHQDGEEELPPWSPSTMQKSPFVEIPPSPEPLNLVKPLTKTPANPEERRLMVEQWLSLCFVKVRGEDGINYAVVQETSEVLQKKNEFIIDFIVEVVENKKSSKEYKALCEAVEKARFRYGDPTNTFIVWNFIEILVCILVESEVSLKPLPKTPPLLSE